MAYTLSQAVQTVSGAAGWRAAHPDELGVYHYLLQEGLDLDLQSPDGRTLIAGCDMGPAPEEDERWELIGRLAAGSTLRRASVLAAEDGRLTLFRRLDLTRVSENELVGGVRDFLNDQVWWRTQLEGAPQSSAGGFSMAGWFPDQLGF
ncbi:MAG: hypothetical protein SPJ12_02825 [Duodenibacillus sp.]|nr:hypothetical protein [Duodenibacillus sp.]